MDKIQDTPIPLSWSGRLLYGYATILMPIVSFIIAFGDTLTPDWQSGNFDAYILIMLGGTVSRYFYPFLAYSIVCMLLLLTAPARFSKYFIVRLGIYTGTILSLQYAILLGITVAHISFYSFVAGGILLPLGIKWLCEEVGTRKLIYIIVGLVSSFWLIWVFVNRDVYQPLLFILIIMLAMAPCWCLILSILVSVRLIKNYEFSLPRTIYGLGLFAWLLPFIGAWRIAILKTLEVYASLPTSQPDCYFATVAAKGHPQFVKSKPIVIENGSVTWINAQLRYFKCAELTLMAICPSGHKVFREIYAVFGIPLMRILDHPLLADLIYITLKPIEWGAKVLLRVLLPDVDEVAKKIYQNNR